MPKTILISFAGTGQDMEGPDRDNPSLLHGLLKAEKYSRSKQVHLYIRGIGTEQKGKLSRLKEQIYADKFPKKVMEGYYSLVKYYEPGDTLILTGFSRGAAIARSLAGMIRNVGIINSEHFGSSKKKNGRLVGEAYVAYAAEKGVDDATAKNFREKYSHFDGVKIDCLAVYDTVLAWDEKGFHDLQVNKMVKVFRHAVSIDERRSVFDWMPASFKTAHTNGETRLFPCAHSDVGGSYQHRGLAQNAFLWLVQEMVKCGLHVPEGYVEALNSKRSLAYVSDSDSSHFDSDDEAGEVKAQEEAAPNPRCKQHFPEKSFPFNFKSKIDREFDFYGKSLKAGEAFNFVIDRSVFDRMDDPERTDNSKKKYRVNPKVSKKVLKRARDNAGSASGAGARPAMGTRAGRGDAILHVGVFAKKRAEAIAAKSELAKKLKLDKKEASSAVDGLGKRWFC